MSLALTVVAALTVAPVLRVAAVFNLSGPMEPVGRPGYNGLTLAAEELNRSKKAKITLFTVDARSRSTVAANALTNLLKRQKIDAVIGLYDSDDALAVGRVAQAAHIPFVSAGATLPGITSTIGNYAFTACYNDTTQARAMARFAREILKVQTVSVLADPSHAYTRTIAKEFPALFVDLGGRWLVTINDPEPGRDIPVKFGSEAVYAATMPKDAAATVRRLRKNGFDGLILSGDGFDTPSLTKQAALAAFKVYYTTHVAYDSPDPLVRAFVKGYTARFKTDPESSASALAYDAMRLVADAASRKGGGSLRNAIAATEEFKGVTGKIGYRDGFREPDKPVSIVEVLGTSRVFRWMMEAPR